jgi:hypothetical protein
MCLRFLRKEFGCIDCPNGGNSNCIDYIEVKIKEGEESNEKEN